MGFPGYFLIVQDFINAARQMDVAVGPDGVRQQVLLLLTAWELPISTL